MASPRAKEVSEPLLPRSALVLQNQRSADVFQDERLGLTLMVFCSLFFLGVSYFNHLAQKNYAIPTVTAIFIRGVVQSVLALVYLVTITEFRKHVPAMASSTRRILALRGFLGALGVVCYNVALNLLALGDASTLYSLTPVATMMLAYVLLGERVSRVEAIAAVVALIGEALIFAPENGELGGRKNGRGILHIVGASVAVVGAMSDSLEYVVVRMMGTDVHFITSVLACGIPTAVLGAVFGGARNIFETTDNLYLGLQWMLLSAVCSFFAQVFLNSALQRCRAGPCLLISCVDIPAIYLLGYLGLGETPPLQRVVGAFLVLVGAVLVAVQNVRE